MTSRAALRTAYRRTLTPRRALVAFTAALGMTGAALAANVSLSTTATAATWPSANGSQAVSATISLSGTKDYAMKRLYGSGALGTGDQAEDQLPILKLAAGTVLKNVIIGAPGADGIHCEGSCTLQNVWWEDVGEDAATFRGPNGSTYNVTGGGARKASDKIFQHNGGGTLNISNFAAQDFKTLYRSCGDCSTSYTRKVNLNTVEVTVPGSRIVGINVNRNDVATLRNITIVGDTSRKIIPCQKYNNNTAVGTGPDSTNCLYTSSNITYR
jgi:hypothetical protein